MTKFIKPSLEDQALLSKVKQIAEGLTAERIAEIRDSYENYRFRIEREINETNAKSPDEKLKVYDEVVRKIALEEIREKLIEKLSEFLLANEEYENFFDKMAQAGSLELADYAKDTAEKLLRKYNEITEAKLRPPFKEGEKPRERPITRERQQGREIRQAMFEDMGRGRR